MKKAILAVAFSLLLAAPVVAGQLPYVGLFGGVYDINYVEGPGGYDHSACSVSVADPYSDIEMWIWWLPDPGEGKGWASVEFKIVYPTGIYIIAGAVTSNPLIVAELGSLPVGIASTVGGLQCQYDWFWSHHQTITLKKITPSGYITIVADPALAVPPYAVLVSDCSFYNHATTILNNLALNQACAIATQDKTWGSIKSLYSE